MKLRNLAASVVPPKLWRLAEAHRQTVHQNDKSLPRAERWQERVVAGILGCLARVSGKQITDLVIKDQEQIEACYVGGAFLFMLAALGTYLLVSFHHYPWLAISISFALVGVLHAIQRVLYSLRRSRKLGGMTCCAFC